MIGFGDREVVRHAHEGTAERGDDQSRPQGPWHRWAHSSRRLSLPVLSALCVCVLLVLVGVALSKGAGGSITPPIPHAGMATPESEMDIVFWPLEEGQDYVIPAASSSWTPQPSTSAANPADYDPASRNPAASNPTNAGHGGGEVLPQPGPSPAPQPPPKVTYTAVGGYSCTADATKNFRHVGRWYEPENKYQSWYSKTSGGWAADGCAGGYEAMPMSGVADTDDPGIYSEWYFVVGATTRSCDVAVYVPYSGTALAEQVSVAGKPAYYQVRDTGTSAPRGTFMVDQWTNRGTWVSRGTWPVNGGRITFRAVNRGVGSAKPEPYVDHIAIAQIRVTCH